MKNGEIQTKYAYNKAKYNETGVVSEIKKILKIISDSVTYNLLQLDLQYPTLFDLFHY